MDKLTRVIIKNAEGGSPDIALPYNPKDITFDQTIPWQPHPNSGPDQLEYTSGGNTTLSLELLIDTYETAAPATELVGRIRLLTEPMRIKGSDKKRPPVCVFVWGSAVRFIGVIESMQTKYTMFLADGTPCRAVVSLKIKRALQLYSQGAKKPNHRQAAEDEGKDDVRELY